MPTTKHATYPSGSEFVKKAAQVADYYGFVPLASLTRERKRAAALPRPPAGSDPFAGELFSAARTVIEHGIHASGAPVLFHHASGNARQKKILFGLQVVGTGKSVGEALVLRTAATILEDMGLQATIAVNSIGDRDSSARFAREIGAYLRKHADNLPPAARELMKEDVFLAHEHLYRKEHDLRANAPRGMEFLSEASRRHLKEVLEYLETVGVPYEIDDGLVGGRDLYTETLFEVRGTHEDGTRIVLARGGRYDDAPRRMFKTPMNAVGLVFTCERDCRSVEAAAPLRKAKRPKIFFIHLGFEAKLKSFAVLEMLRRARVPVEQSIAHDKFAGQLAIAENLAVPYVIIMGQKEALEGTVIVRHMGSRSQQTIPVPRLSAYLKEAV